MNDTPTQSIGLFSNSGAARKKKMTKPRLSLLALLLLAATIITAIRNARAELHGGVPAMKVWVKDGVLQWSQTVP